MYIIGNHAVATVFITAIALTISAGTRRVDVGTLLADRGLDTVIGCGLGTAVFLLMARRQEAQRLTESIAGVIEGTIRATEFIINNDVSSFRPATLDVRCRTASLIWIRLRSRPGTDHTATRQKLSGWTVPSSPREELGYATVAACWKAERHMPGLSGSAEYLTRLRTLAQAVQAGTTSPMCEELSVLCAPEVLALKGHGGLSRQKPDR